MAVMLAAWGKMSHTPSSGQRPLTIQKDTYTIVPFLLCMGYGTQLHNISPTLVITLLLHVMCKYMHIQVSGILLCVSYTFQTIPYLVLVVDVSSTFQ